ncbi:putative lipid-binding transport protein (Tim44 family) [Methanocalculus sp. AMF5]|uniref:hypothetical protein n=1 Tax=Methanocalculus sp. AMF5 TaxID=1198257 RepID=UPI00209D4A90|nr:hypothetical protein [Methanocalculus sp. AMF5]MCP1663273.1 putative lipid-binding transport protein (Tim44 family) [Methanocalculus sp. AMF5]
MDTSFDVVITRRLWIGTLITGLGMGLLLELVFRIFNGSQLLPVFFFATMAGVVLVFRRWVLNEFQKQSFDKNNTLPSD